MNDADDSDSDWFEVVDQAANVEEEMQRHGLYLLTNPKETSNLLLYALEIHGKHRTHTPFNFLIRGTPRTKYGIILMTTDGNAVETTKRRGPHIDIYNNRLFVLEVTIPEGGEYKFSLDHCETSFLHNNKLFQYLAVQLDDDGSLPLNDRDEFVQYEETLSSCPFWVESRDTRSKRSDDIVGSLRLIENVELQGDSITRAFTMLPRRDTKPMAPDEEIRYLRSRKRPHDEMAENEEDVAERKRFEELWKEKLRSGGGRLQDSSFLPNSADLNDVDGKFEFKSYDSFVGGKDSSNSQDSYTINEDSSCGVLYFC